MGFPRARWAQASEVFARVKNPTGGKFVALLASARGLEAAVEARQGLPLGQASHHRAHGPILLSLGRDCLGEEPVEAIAIGDLRCTGLLPERCKPLLRGEALELPP